MAGLRIKWRRASTLRAAPLDLALGRTALVWLAALVIVAGALALRYGHAGWDANTHRHPDERFLTIVANDIELPGSISEYFDSAGSRLNPYNHPSGGSFVYGTLPLFLTKASAVLLGQDSYDDIVIVGRHLSALFSAATVLVVFLIARRLYGEIAALLGAALMATAPLAIQHAHFFVVDPFLTFFTTLVLFFSVRIAREGRRSDYVLAGLALGLGMACKVTAALAAPVIVAAVLVRLAPALREAFDRRSWRSWLALRLTQDALLGAVLALLVAFLAFRVAQPYAFETPRLSNLGVQLDSRWVKDQKDQSRLLGGEVAFPPSVQWVQRSSYVYPLEEMVHWGMAPAFGLAGWLGFAYAAYRLVRRREMAHLLPAIFVAVYFGFMGRQFSLYMRYFLPLYPVLALFGGWLLLRLWQTAREAAARWRRPALQPLAATAIGLTLVLAALTGLAYYTIYTRPTTHVQASAWMYAELPSGSRIAVEHWDESVPFPVPGAPDKRFQLLELQLYDPDSRAKVEKLISTLDQADYVVLSSNRLLNSIPREPFNYPVTTRYYDLLFKGGLGFERLRSFTSYPGLLGVDFPDYSAEESWSSYDHPRVLVFKKTTAYSHDLAESLLGSGPFTNTYLTPKQAEHNGLLLSPADQKTQQEGGTWTSIFSSSGIAASNPTLVWLVALQLASLAVTPLTMVLFRGLRDRGYLLAKPLGVLALGYLVWISVSFKLVTFNETTILAVLILLALAGAVTLWLAGPDLLDFAARHWRLILFSEALFLAAFFFSRELRLINPDLWHPYRGGEKPMDLAYLTAVTRSTTLPPYDPWFAGGYINYYYLGQFFTATLSKLTTVPPQVAFNLAVPTYFALACAGAYCVAFNLASAARSFWRGRRDSPPVPPWSAAVAGLLGVFFVAFAGNLDAVDQTADRLSAVSPWHLHSAVPLLPAVINSAGGLWEVLFHGAHLAEFDYWRPSRMLPPTISITEFPYFSFLFADLHAHMMAIPFQILAIAGGLTLALARPAEARQLRTWGLVALLSLVVGSLRWLNSWDYPPFLLLALAALVINERRLEGGWRRAGLRLAGKAALLVALSFLLYKPFLDNYQSPASGLHASPETTPLRQYLAHFGIFVAIIGAWLLFLIQRALRASPLVLSRGGYRRQTPRSESWLALAAIATLALLGVCLVLVADGHAFVAALLPVLALVVLLAMRELLHPRPDGGLRLFLLALVALGLGLSMGVDLVTINGDINRMNTVFKFYLHTWVVFALVSAFASWMFLFTVWPAALKAGAGLITRQSATLGVLGLTALLLAAAIYPIAATPVRLDDRFSKLPKTLDGTAYMRTAIYQDPRGQISLRYDYEGIQWLRQNVKGSPVIVEGRTDLYRWGGRFSIYTGLPAVIGWDWHQRQQRGSLAGLVERRGGEVDDFYAKTDPLQALRFLQQYDVRYVILGQLERLYYPGAGLAKLQSGLGGVLQPVYSNAALTIFEVAPDRLDASLRANP